LASPVAPYRAAVGDTSPGGDVPFWICQRISMSQSKKKFLAFTLKE
jgi:hypothetical protein